MQPVVKGNSSLPVLFIFPQWLNSPGWTLAFSRILLPASVLQFLVLKTRRYFSGPSIASKIWSALSPWANWLGIEDFSGVVFFHSLTTLRALLIHCNLMKLTISDSSRD
ncbi:hypothetical protein TNCV_783941 [Trichonephila clavipes]|nr:hypothetical protein TNCV_783941 [Trichonephila clavipes]